MYKKSIELERIVDKLYNFAKSRLLFTSKFYFTKFTHERDGTVIIQRFAFFDPQYLRLFLKILVKYMNQTYKSDMKIFDKAENNKFARLHIYSRVHAHIHTRARMRAHAG